MVEFSHPGIYIAEGQPGPGPIQGVSPSALGLVGYTPKGVVNYPILCTSYPDFVNKFGTFTADSLTPTTAYAFFANGGRQLWQVRVVHPDAEKSLIDWIVSQTGEVLTSTAQATGLYTLDTNKVPVVGVAPGSVTITFESATRPNVFTDNGLGVLTKTSGAGAGGTGSIDYNTGEISIQLTTPGDYTGTTDDVLITYSYKVATYTMKWEGAAGNNFRVRIVGSPNYYNRATASYSAFTVYVEENTTPTATATWVVRESFDPATFTDPNDSNYFVTIMNDPNKGSDIVTVTDYGNAQTIASLVGTAVTAEAITNSPAYSGTAKAFTYTLPSGSGGVSEGTVALRFKFIEDGLRIGTGDGTATPATNALGYAIEIGGGTIATAKASVGLTLTAGGATVLYDDGAGNLRSGPFPGTVHGTIDYTDGTVALSVSGTTVVAGTAITIDAVYADDVNVADDGNGNMTVQTPVAGTDPPLKFQLDSAANNTVNYDAGTVALTWKVVGAPASGPAGVDPGATAATKVGAIGPYVLTPGASFALDVNNVGIATTTFDAAAGYVTDTTTYPVADQNGKTLIIEIDGTERTILFAGVTTTAASIISQINPQVLGGYAADQGGQVRIYSDSKGTGSSVVITGGTTDLTFGASTAGTGDVVNIYAVTPAEVKTRVEADTTAAVTVNSNNSFSISSPTLGVASELDFSSAIAALGLSVEVIIGTSGASNDGQSATYYTAPSDEVTYTLIGGLDGSATDRTDVTFATLEATYGGMYALQLVNETMQVVIADFQTDASVARDVISFCERLENKFAILTVPEGLSYQEAVKWKKFTLNNYSNYAALYYPHIQITDPVSGNTMNLPCGGHLAGIYAKTDNNRNVAKAPAGTLDGKLSWYEGLEVSLQDSEIGYCNLNNVNCLTDAANRGTVVWGARTMEIPGGSMIYVPQRRTFIYVKQSVLNATQIHVFQPNGPALWSAISSQLTAFLLGLTQANYFASTTPSEAFFVQCDSNNNDAQSNIVYCDVGLATQTPAEFILFTFSQKAVG